MVLGRLFWTVFLLLTVGSGVSSFIFPTWNYASAASESSYVRVPEKTSVASPPGGKSSRTLVLKKQGRTSSTHG